MCAKKCIVLGLLGCAALVFATGCPFNPFQDNLVTAGLKVLNGRMTTMTPREVQILSDFVVDQQGVTDVAPLTSQEAQAIVDVIQEFQLDSIQDIQDLLNDPERLSTIDPTLLATLERLAQGRYDQLNG
jgi:hypothetical protein